MKLSIVLATRDRPHHLPTAITSVLEQDDPRWELVILDNGDSVEHLVPSDLRVRYVHDEASGPADAYQRALTYATGDVVLPLADDDRLAPHTVRTILDGIGDSEWGYAQTAYQVNGATQFLLGSEWSLEALRRDYYLGGAVFWRRALTDRLGGFDEAYDHAADYDLYLRFGEDSDPVYIPEVLYLYNDWEGTDSRLRGDLQQSAAARVRSRAPRRRVTIVTPWIDHHDLLDGWLAATEGADERIVIDNGGAPAAELRTAGVSVVSDGVAHGFAASNNLGGTFSTGDVVVFLNNDVTGDGSWIDHARGHVADGGLYGPAIHTTAHVGVPGVGWAGILIPGTEDGIPYVEGWCVAATKGTWERVGWWDADAFPDLYWEDVDVSLRAVRAGVTLNKAPWNIQHIGGASTSLVEGAWDGFERQREVVRSRLMELIPA